VFLKVNGAAGISVMERHSASSFTEGHSWTSVPELFRDIDITTTIPLRLNFGLFCVPKPLF
jgi:hypothetical protein